MGTFDGLQVSLSSLFAQRRGLDVTGQNIANANTEGYSRQRVVMSSIGGNTVPAIFSTWNGSSGGVKVADVTRMRDTFMEIRGRAAHASLERTTVTQQTLAQVEQLVNEPSDTGLSESLSDLWAGFDEVSNNPGKEAPRSLLLQRASAVSDWLNAAHAAISEQWSADSTQLNALASEANTAAAGIAELNGAISRATIAGIPSNELADQRDLLAMKLSGLTGATTRVGDDGSLDVFLGNTSFVRGTVAEQLKMKSGSPADMAGTTTGTVALSWVDGSPVDDLGGTTAGYLDVLNVTLPGFGTGLDKVANSIRDTVNAQHAKGVDLAGVTGGAFFTGTGAADLSVASTLTTSTIAAGAGPQKTPLEPGLDGSNADALAALASSSTGPDSVFRTFVVDLGVTALTVNRRVDVQTSVTSDIDDARDATAGVNIDEEMVNMLTFQRAYEAASRTLTAVDQMLDTLINHTGLVGR